MLRFYTSRSVRLSALTLILMACSNDRAANKVDAGLSDDAGEDTGEDAGSSGEDVSEGSDGDGAVSGETDPSSDDGSTPAACSGGCDDNIDCTTDTCLGDTCVHVLDATLCESGASCDPQQGCVVGPTCGKDSDCTDTNPCTLNERCDAKTARCTWDPLDRDGDRQAPIACGGSDCNDADGRIAPNAIEVCNGVDDNCDSSVDDGVTCSGGGVCTAGACKCPEGTTECGAECVDLKTSAQHCGMCRTSCGSGGQCSDGACSCPAPAMMCGNSCSDTQISAANCGGCDMPCAPVDRMGQVRACIGGACTACGGESQVCCGGATQCVGTLTCSAGKCECAGKQCGGACVDLTNDRLNCGACGTVCQQDETCTASGCVPCGAVGQVCCDFGLPGVESVCGRGLACGAGDVCVHTP